MSEREPFSDSVLEVISEESSGLGYGRIASELLALRREHRLQTVKLDVMRLHLTRLVAAFKAMKPDELFLDGRLRYAFLRWLYAAEAEMDEDVSVERIAVTRFTEEAIERLPSPGTDPLTALARYNEFFDVMLQTIEAAMHVMSSALVLGAKFKQRHPDNVEMDPAFILMSAWLKERADEKQ